MTFHRSVDTAWPIWAKSRVGYPYMMPLGKHEFRDYRYGDRHTIRNRVVHDILSIFCAMFVRFGQNRRSKNYTLTRGANKFLSVLSTFMSDLREFGKWDCMQSCCRFFSFVQSGADNAVLFLRLSETTLKRVPQNVDILSAAHNSQSCKEQHLKYALLWSSLKCWAE